MWLKRSTPQNIVIGGAAGAFPPMIGWACVTNSVTIESIVLFLIIFLWTPAHFWALALFKMRDYEAVGVPMLPNVSGERDDQAPDRRLCGADRGLRRDAVLPRLCEHRLRRLSQPRSARSSYTVPSPSGACRMAISKMIPAKKLFAFSIFYLFAIFSALMIDRLASLLVSHAGGLF